jgi:pyrrolidone-carboxylate peptidase
MPSDEKPPIQVAPHAPGIVKSQDAGGYYCGHLYFLLHQVVKTPRPLSERFEAGPCVGFLHVPQDEWMTVPRGTKTPVERHLSLHEIWTDIFRGLLARQVSGLRLLISGFGPFAQVTHNPTEDFIEHHTALLLDAMDCAFDGQKKIQANDWDLGFDGAKRETSRHPPDGLRLHNVIDVPDLKWTIGTVILPVNDACLQTDPTSGLGFLESWFRPNAAIAMGVARGEHHFRVECVAKNDNLEMVDGRYIHTPDRSARQVLPGNDWLWEIYAAGVAACSNRPRKIWMGN